MRSGKDRQQGFAGADGPPAHKALAVGVVGDQLLVPLELRPANVTLMVLRDQSLPAAPVALHASNHALAPVLDGYAGSPAAKGVGARINWVGQHVMDRRIDRQTPDDSVGGRSLSRSGQKDLLLPAPHQDLADRLKLRKLAKHQCDGLLYAAIRILLDTVSAGLHVADRHGEEEFAPARLLLHRFDRALPKDRELHLAHRAFHAEQEPIIGRGHVVDAVLVDDQRADQAAELQESVPVAPIARQSRRLQREYGADAAFANRGQKLFEARPPAAGARSAEVVVDHFDVRPAKLAGPPRYWKARDIDDPDRRRCRLDHPRRNQKGPTVAGTQC